MSALSSWKQRLKLRRKRLKEAEAYYQRKQAALEKATRKQLPTVAKLRDRVERAAGRVRRAKRDVAQAKRGVANNRRLAPAADVTRISRNRSSRGGVKPRLIVLHITVSMNKPGLQDVIGILEFFDRPSTQASSHIVNDREGNDGRCVPDEWKAWTCAAYNPQSLNIEQIEYEVKSRARWMSESRKQLDNTALWVAYWSQKYNIPLVHSTTRGVCQHRDLGAAGGGHADCSPDYPLDYVLGKAQEILSGHRG